MQKFLIFLSIAIGVYSLPSFAQNNSERNLNWNQVKSDINQWFGVEKSPSPDITQKQLGPVPSESGYDAFAYQPTIDEQKTNKVVSQTVSKKEKSFFQKVKEFFSNEEEMKAKAIAEKENQKKSEIKKREALLPTYISNKKAISQKSLSDAKKALQSAKGISLSTQGTSPDAQLKTDQAGVPTFDLYTPRKGKKSRKIKVSHIPVLGVGEEPRISADQLLLQIQIPKANFKEAQKLKSPRLTEDKVILKWAKSVESIKTDLKTVDRKKYGIGDLVTKKKIDRVIWKNVAEFAGPEAKEYYEYSKSDLKMLTAVMIKEKKKCPVSMGLFDELAKDKIHGLEARFHLGLCAHKLKLYTAAAEHLMPIVKMEDPDLTPEAIATLSQKIPNEYNVQFAKAIRNIKDKSLIPERSKSNVNYLLAKGSFIKGKNRIAEGYALKVDQKNQYYKEARIILALSQYSNRKNKTAVQTLENLRSFMKEKKIEDKNIEALSAITIARISYQSKNYKKAFDHYKMIPKNHPLWLEGVIEQGWSQLSLGDPSGAIGNMYSLHSPYFTAVYKPQSYAIRTIGYLNICQYGDAYRTLNLMERNHKIWLSKVGQYIKNQRSKSLNYYQTLRKYLRNGRSSADVDGLPFQVIREMGRQREFINIQKEINEKIDEASQFASIKKSMNKEISRIKWRRGKAQVRVAKLKNKIKLAKTNSNMIKDLNQWKGQLRFESDVITLHNFLLSNYYKSRKKFSGYQRTLTQILDKKKRRFKAAAGNKLMQALKNIESELASLIDNNEFLRYDIFTGSGENIRYQVTGGKIKKKNRIPSSVRPTKILKWEFDGEYWEDEIGSYRSTLQNNCPKSVSQLGR